MAGGDCPSHRKLAHGRRCGDNELCSQRMCRCLPVARGCGHYMQPALDELLCFPVSGCAKLQSRGPFAQRINTGMHGCTPVL